MRGSHLARSQEASRFGPWVAVSFVPRLGQRTELANYTRVFTLPGPVHADKMKVENEK